LHHSEYQTVDKHKGRQREEKTQQTLAEQSLELCVNGGDRGVGKTGKNSNGCAERKGGTVQKVGP
jgi:hypothetical protein